MIEQAKCPLILIGAGSNRKLVSKMLKHFVEKTGIPSFIMRENGPKVIHINFSSAKVDQIYFPHHEVVGDIANAVWQISEKIVVQSYWNFSHFLAIKKSFSKEAKNLVDNNCFPLIKWSGLSRQFFLQNERPC